MKPNLSVTIVGTIEGALQRTIIYSDEPESRCTGRGRSTSGSRFPMTNPLTPETIRELRRRLGLTQPAFAVRLGVSVQAVRHWEQGLRTPTGLYAKALRALIKQSPR